MHKALVTPLPGLALRTFAGVVLCMGSASAQGGLALPQVSAAASTATSAPALQLQRASVKPAKRDPFASYTPPPAPQAKAAPVPAPIAAPPLAAPLPAPALPSVNLVFVGRMWQGGDLQVLATHQGSLLMLQPGLALPSGYVVQAIGEQEVELMYEPLKHVERWPLPPLPKHETR